MNTNLGTSLTLMDVLQIVCGWIDTVKRRRLPLDQHINHFWHEVRLIDGMMDHEYNCDCVRASPMNLCDFAPCGNPGCLFAHRLVLLHSDALDLAVLTDTAPMPTLNLAAVLGKRLRILRDRHRQYGQSVAQRLVRDSEKAVAAPPPAAPIDSVQSFLDDLLLLSQTDGAFDIDAAPPAAAPAPASPVSSSSSSDDDDSALRTHASADAVPTTLDDGQVLSEEVTAYVQRHCTRRARWKDIDNCEAVVTVELIADLQTDWPDDA